jgi:predicted anti-sigma-YlaC factor YlaD
VSRSQLERLLRLVAHTEDEELSCTACFELLPLYVDLDFSGENPDVRLPLFRRHLEQCPACREEYEAVRELARLEAEGRSPSIDDLRRSH